jgi:hypothetical protein
MKDLMKKCNMSDLKPVSTPMSTMSSLDPNENGEAADQREYRSIIGSLLYLMDTWPDIQFTMCLCARFQASLHSSHQTTVQGIFRYLKHTLEFEICYSTSSSLDLVGFFGADFVGCGIDRKSTSGTCHFLGSSLVCWSFNWYQSLCRIRGHFSSYGFLLTLMGACTMSPSACSHLSLFSGFEMCGIAIKDDKKRSGEIEVNHDDLEVMDILKSVLDGECADDDLLPKLLKMNKSKLVKGILTLIP